MVVLFQSLPSCDYYISTHEHSVLAHSGKIKNIITFASHLHFVLHFLVIVVSALYTTALSGMGRNWKSMKARARCVLGRP